MNWSHWDVSHNYLAEQWSNADNAIYSPITKDSYLPQSAKTRP